MRRKNASGYFGPELPGDRNLRELVQAAVWAAGQPCQRTGRNRACPCGPCSAKRAVARLRLAAKARPVRGDDSL